MVLEEELFEEKKATGNLLEEGLFEILEEETSEAEIKKWIDNFMSNADLSSHISHEGKKVYRTYGTRAYYYLMCDKLGLTPEKETAYQAEAENDDFELDYTEGDIDLIFKNDKYFKSKHEEAPLDESKLVEGAKSFLRDLGKDNIQYFTLYNRFNYTINQLRVDNENKTYEKGEFVVGSKGYTTHNGAEFKRLVAELEDRGYTEVKNESLKEEVVEELSEFEKKAKATAEKLGIEIRLRGNDRFDLETLDREKLEKFYRELLGVEMGKVQGLEEEIGDVAEVSEAPIEEEPTKSEQTIGLTTIVNNLIADELQAIDGYNSSIVTFETEGRGEFTDVFRAILKDEQNHIGNLEKVLNELDPTALVNIKKGQLEAEEQLGNKEKETPEEEIKVEIE